MIKVETQTGYFLKNSSPLQNEILLLDSESQLDSDFGIARTMGEFRPIFWPEEFVIAYVGKTSSNQVEISLEGSNTNQRHLNIYIKEIIGKKVSYTSSPILLLRIPRRTFLREISVFVNFEKKAQFSL